MSNPTNSRAFPDILRISYLLRNTYNSPPEKQTKRLKQQQSYYGKTMPLTYSHFFGLIGLLRKTITLITSIFRPAPLYVSECDTRGGTQELWPSCTNFHALNGRARLRHLPAKGFDSRRVKRVLHLPHGAQINLIVACGIRTADGVRGELLRLPFADLYRKV